MGNREIITFEDIKELKELMSKYKSGIERIIIDEQCSCGSYEYEIQSNKIVCSKCKTQSTQVNIITIH